MYMQQENQDEQEFQMPHLPLYQFKLQPKQKIACNTLIIGFYGPSSLFCQSLVVNKQPTHKLNFLKSKQRSQANVYTDKDTCYLIFNEQFENMKQIHFSKFLFEHFQFKSCLMLLSLTKGSLNNTGTITSFLKYIATSKWSERCLGSKFDEGLMGPAADVLAWGQVFQLPIACYVGIFGQYQLNKSIIQDGFGILRGKYGLNNDEDISQLIKKYNMKKYSNKLYL